MRINPTEWLCDTLEECCERYYSGYNKNKCINEQGSGLWYVDHLNKRCVVDCDESSKYLRDLYLLFLVHLDVHGTYTHPCPYRWTIVWWYRYSSF